jgi:hypothetical protein
VPQVYREALGIGTPFYRFLPYWNVVDAVHDGREAQVNAFLQRNVSRLAKRRSQPLSGNQAVPYLRKQVRDAIAHVIPDNRARQHLDPDVLDQRDRVHEDAGLMKDLARTAILDTWRPDPVKVEYRAADAATQGWQR